MVLDPNEANRTQPVDDQGRRRQVRKAAVASAVGTSIEWYDFFLYGTAAALVFPKLFFPDSTHYVGVLESFATYAVGFAARPVGAAIFGHWGDRLGRKAVLIVTLLTMGLSTALIGVLPGESHIGLWAPILLVVLRILQGIAVGGEWSGSVLLSMEWGNQKRRGLMGAWPQLGVAIGLILANGILTIFNNVMSTDSFDSWGWRIPFLLSLVMVAVGLYIRLSILETPMFSRVVAERQVVKAPVPQVIQRYWREIILAALVRLSEQAPFYVITTFVLTYLQDHGHSHNFVLTGTLLAATVEFMLVPYFGHLSDTVGRKRIYMIGAALMGVWGFAYFGLLNSGTTWVVFIALILGLIPHAIQYGPQSSLVAEIFPTNLRYGGSGIGYQLASLVAGGPAPLIATYLTHHFDSVYVIAVYILLCSIITLIATALIPDHSKTDIEDDGAYREPVQASTAPAT